MNDILTDIDKDLDVVFGEYRDVAAVDSFVASVRAAELKGTLYIGYPVLAIDDEKIEYDAILVSRDRGIIVFDLYSIGEDTTSQVIPEVIIQRQEQLYAALYNRLNSFSELRRRRDLIVTIRTASIHPISDCFVEENDSVLVGIHKLAQLDLVTDDKKLTNEEIEHLNAAIQRISNLKPKKKRDNVIKKDSKGAKIKEIEKQVANLDLWQKRGAIEYVNGPQRIRGLAGSGKTVVLALKAAYLHVKRPEWNIVITFSTRSLYQQFESLVTRFVFAQINEEPDWEKLHIMHAWGGSDRGGVYKDFIDSITGAYRDFGTAARLFGYDTAFDGACKEALDYAKNLSPEKYDMILIDEAQDLPSSFFKIVYRMTKKPKRIVWAYDDLQNLGDVKMPSTAELFGSGDDGKSIVNLENQEDQPQQDIVLPRCYRNPPWTLLTAHGLGFGVHRTPMANMFQDLGIWKRLGYSAVGGSIDFDQNVTLSRATESVPTFFNELLKPESSLQVLKYDEKNVQYNWMAEEIKKLIEEDELQHSDFLIILPNVRTSKSESIRILRTFMSYGLDCHIPGQTSSRDELFRENSIAVTHIHRAKGNEAPVVFIVNSEFCESDFQIKKRRNIIFTAMTRSRAWTYVLGVGEEMNQIEIEYATIRDNEFSLKFHYPGEQEAKALAVSSMEEIDESAESHDDKFQDLRSVIAKIKESGEQIPLDLQEQLKDISGEGK